MRTTIISLLAFVLAGCAGYKIGPIKPKIMKDVTSIAVPTFKTQILQPGIESLLANVLIRHIQRDGTYKVADEKDADAILTCTLEGLDRRPNLSVTGNQLLTAQYQLVMRVSYKLTNRKTGEPIDNRTASGTTYFFATGSNTLASDVNQDEQQAIPLAADDMAQHLVSQISEGW